MRIGSSLLTVLTLLFALLLTAPSQAAPATCHGKTATLVQSSDESIEGTPGDDVVVLTNTAQDRVNVFDGNGGDDTVCAVGENLIRLGDGDDWVQTGAGDDRVLDSGGADHLDAGAGRDFLDYRGRSTGLSIDLGAGTVTGPDGSGSIHGFEGVAGSSSDDVLRGSDAADRFENSGGHDEAFGLGGNDTFTAPSALLCRGGLGGMVSHGGAGRDSFFLADGDEGYGDEDDDTGRFGAGSVFHGGSGADRAVNTWLDEEDDWDEGDECPARWPRRPGGRGYGDSGRDTLEFDWSRYYISGGIRAHLATGVAQPRTRPEQGSVRLTGFEVLAGGPLDDLLYGDAGANRLYGRGGNDRIRGAGGNDHLNGGAGNDRGYGGPGRDSCRRVEHRSSC